jgi:hypothetical protein
MGMNRGLPRTENKLFKNQALRKTFGPNKHKESGQFSVYNKSEFCATQYCWCKSIWKATMNWTRSYDGLPPRKHKVCPLQRSVV